VDIEPLHHELARFDLAGLAERDEGLEQLFDNDVLGAVEGFG
jgi:hypothetical protein